LQIETAFQQFPTAFQQLKNIEKIATTFSHLQQYSSN